MNGFSGSCSSQNVTRNLFIFFISNINISSYYDNASSYYIILLYNTVYVYAVKIDKAS